MLASRCPCLPRTALFFLCHQSFVPEHRLQTNLLDCSKFRAMSSKKPISDPSKIATSKGGNDRVMQLNGGARKESEVDMDGGIGSFVDDPSRLEAMTVKELRTLMKDAGIPIKGSKRDLLSTLRSHLNAQALGEDMPSHVEKPQDKSKPTKRKSGVSLSKGNLSTSDEMETDKKRSRCKPRSSNNMDLRESVQGDEKISDKLEDAGTKRSRSSKKTTSKIEISCESVVSEPWTILAHKKPKDDWVPYNPKVLRPLPLANDVKSVKLMSWNVNGLRALLKSDGFSLLHRMENFDVICLQETKMQEKDVEAIKQSLLDGYENSFWTCSITKLGYSGTAIISRIKPISVSYGLGIVDHDGEGRLVTAEFENFYLLSGYVPNSGDGLRRLSYRINEWDPSLGNYMKDLEKRKPVILTGDLNCAHEEIDIHDPAGNRRSAGFTDEERKSFHKNFLARGFVDTFRKQHPSVVGYTYYGYRHGGRKTNKGWRLDYFLVSKSIADQVHDSYIVPEIGGSDHCPIGLILRI